jgi:rod shape-determining protein MreC
MALLDIRQRTGWLFAAVVVSHIVLISAQVTTKRGVPVLQEVTFGAFAEMQRATTGVVSNAREGWQNYFALQQIRQENERLRKEVAELRISMQQERTAAQETRSLQRLLELKSSVGFHTTAANVIGSGADPTFRTITIDKGTQDGLRANMAVIAPAGVVGRILLPTARASKVQLLIDRDAAAGVMVERSRVNGVATGVGSSEELGFQAGLVELRYVPGSADVQKGDSLVTSGIDGIYPKGLPIGQIQSTDRVAGQWHVKAKPAVDFSSLEAVLVVLDAGLDESKEVRPAADGDR